MRRQLHSARAAGRGRRRFGLFGGFAAIHLGFVVHAAVHRAILHGARAILHGTGAVLHGARAGLHAVGTRLGGGSHGAILHGTGASAALHGAGSRRGLGEGSGAETKGTSSSGEKFDGLHDNVGGK
jgi:hypothetical protein